MADMSKAEKLAAARKKLREFQHNRENVPISGDNKRSKKTLEQSVTSPKSSPAPNKDDMEPKSSDLMNDNNPLDVQQQSCDIINEANVENNSSKHFETHNQEPLLTTNHENDICVADNIKTSTPISGVLTQNQNETNMPNEAGYPNLESIQSTSESLFQLVMQMNGLNGDNEMETTGSPTIVADNTTFQASSELLIRNQQLASQLADKEQLLDELRASLTQLQSQLKHQEEASQQTLVKTESKWSLQLETLRDELKLHTQTVGLLVAEKTEAQAALSRAQLAAKNKAAEAEEAQGRLRASRQKLSELEAALSSLKSDKEQEHVQLQTATTELEKLRKQLHSTTEQLREVREENSQIQQRLQLSSQQINLLQTEITEKQSQLSIAQVRLQQLGGSVPGGNEVPETQADLQEEHERRMVLEQELSELRIVVTEKEQCGQQYQQFIQQLNTQLTSLAAKLQESSEENTTLKERNQSLMRHMSDLESRLQVTQTTVSSPSPQEIEEREKLALQVKTLTDSKAVLEIKLSGEEAKVTELQAELTRMHEKIEEMQENRPDDAKLLAAMESDKVAAARATTQNAQLKQQLLEAQHMQTQLVDQLRHFEARSHQAEVLQNDLLNAQEQLKTLKTENVRLKTMPKMEVEKPSEEKVTTLTPEAAARLQERFTETMRLLAETSDEKQRLEHLVMQLQGETDTIGEYVALYQQQRGMLQQRAAEKDLEVARMAADREQMRQKLQHVSQLVSVLVSGNALSQQSLENADTSVQQRNGNSEVAAQISALLSEIGDSEVLAEPVKRVDDMVHHSNVLHSKETMLPCPLCSGRLEVV